MNKALLVIFHLSDVRGRECHKKSWTSLIKCDVARKISLACLKAQMCHISYNFFTFMYTARRICRVRSCVKSWLQFFSRRLYFFFALRISINNVHDNLAMYSENKAFHSLEFTFGVAVPFSQQLLFISHFTMIYGAWKTFLLLEIYFALQRREVGSKTFKCIESKWGR